MVQFTPIYQSPIVRIARWFCDGHSRTPGEPAWSREPTFAFVLHGLFRRHVGKDEILAAPGDALFFSEGSEYRTSHPHEGGDHGVGIRVDPEIMEEILGRAGCERLTTKGLLYSSSVALDRVFQLRCVVGALERGAVDPLSVEETVLHLLNQVARDMVVDHHDTACRPSTRAAHQTAVERVIETIETRLHERLHLEDLARDAAYSPFQLCRVFKKQTGLTLHAYLTRQRLLRALEALQEGENLARLATELGFASHSHFSMVFKRVVGYTPCSVKQEEKGG